MQKLAVASSTVRGGGKRRGGWVESGSIVLASAGRGLAGAFYRLTAVWLLPRTESHQRGPPTIITSGGGLSSSITPSVSSPLLPRPDVREASPLINNDVAGITCCRRCLLILSGHKRWLKSFHSRDLSLCASLSTRQSPKNSAQARTWCVWAKRIIS
jgi:hypothetical protein